MDSLVVTKQRLVDLAWATGVHAYRLARRLPAAPTIESALWWAAGLVFPPSVTEQQVSLPSKLGTLWFPPGYRDTRSVRLGLFQSDETRLFERTLQSGMTVVDVGAYAGYFTVLAARLVGPSGRVFAFEPDPVAEAYLQRNLRENALSNATPVQSALSDRAGTLALVRDPRGPESYVTTPSTSREQTAVDAITLDGYLARNAWPRLDLVKMNIEGGEHAALGGMKQASLRNPKLQLIMEFNVKAMHRAGVSREALAGRLRELGFSRSWVVELNMRALRDDELLPNTRAVYNLFLTKD